MMLLNLTNAHARLSPHAISSSNAASLHLASFFRKQTCNLYGCNYFDGLAQDCSYYLVLAMELLQACIKPSTINLPWDWTTKKALATLGTNAAAGMVLTQKAGIFRLQHQKR